MQDLWTPGINGVSPIMIDIGLPKTFPANQTRLMMMVLGMHRSGTSALTRVLNLLGLGLGEDLLPPAADNPAGFWEHRGIHELLGRIMDRVDRDWMDISPMPAGFEDRPEMAGLRAELKEAIEGELGKTPRWAVKDPRICELLPLWLGIASELAVPAGGVIIVRNPGEVAGSLLKRDGNPPERSLAIWMRYMLDAERGTRGIPRAFVSYAGLLNDWRAEMDRVARTLGLTWPTSPERAAGEIDAFLKPDLRHHTASDAGLLEDAGVPASVREAYRLATSACAEGGDSAEFRQAMDELAERVGRGDETQAAVLPMVERQRYQQVRAAHIQLLERGQEMAETTSRLEAAAAGSARRAEDAEARAGIAAAAQAELARSLEEERARAGGLAAELATSTSRAEELTAELAESRSRADGLAGELSASQSRAEGLGDELARSRSRAEGLAGDLSAATARGERLGTELERAEAEATEEATRHRAQIDLRDDRLADMTAAARKRDAQYNAKVGELGAYQLQRHVLTQVLQRMQKSRSWRVTSLLRRASKLLMPVSVTELELVPCTPVRPGPNGGWEAVGVLPQMVLPCAPMSGWVRIELEIWVSDSSRAHLYFDTGSMFNEREHLDLGPVRGEVRREMLYHLPGPTYCFRLDPMRVVGEFRIKTFRVTPLAGITVDLLSLARRFREYRAGRPTKDSLVNGLKFLTRGNLVGFRSKLRAALASTVADNGSDYDLWRQARMLTDEGREKLRAEAATMVDPPKFSVLIPTYNTPERWLRACLESVIAQTYPHWEICVADDKSPDPKVRAVLEEYAARDGRIRVTYREKNGNISAATNTALEMATGDYVALLDHDDALAEHALSTMAREIAADRSVDMLYSDEDKLTVEDKHLDPFFKPDWSPEYFMTCMYTCHLGVYRTSKLREIGGFRSEFDFAQDYDMVLRFTRATNKIRHVPDVLYHWRIIATSTAGGADAKPEAAERARRALQEHVEAGGVPGRIEAGPTEGYHRVRYKIVGNPRVSVVIPTASGKAPNSDKYLVAECVRSIREKSTYDNIEVVVVDNDDMPADLRKQLEAYDVVRVPFKKKFNLAVKLNDGAAASTGEHVLLLNDDIEVITPEWIEEMLGFSQLPGVGAVGCKLVFPDGLIQHAGVIVTDGNPGHPYYRFPADHPGYFYSVQAHRNFTAVTGACVMCPREAYFSVGGFSPEFPLNYNDVDFCLKLREKGYRVVYTPYAELFHHESVSKEGTYNTELDHFKEVWLKRFPKDPMFNPNLNPAYTDWRIMP